jgi:hypothetical protein
MELPEEIDISQSPHLCAYLQFKSTRLGCDLIRATAVVDRANITRASTTYKMLLNPTDIVIAAAKFMNNELLYKRIAAQHILQECIERTNATVDHLDEQFDNKFIEHTSELYCAFMGMIEAEFDQTLCREAQSLGPLLYWLESVTNVSDLCDEMLLQNDTTAREAEILAMIHHTDPQPTTTISTEGQ